MVKMSKDLSDLIEKEAVKKHEILDSNHAAIPTHYKSTQKCRGPPIRRSAESDLEESNSPPKSVNRRQRSLDEFVMTTKIIETLDQK